MDRLVFINDNDAGSGNTSTFSNVKIYEGSCGGSALTESIANQESITPILGTDKEFSAFGTIISPNPVRNSFTISMDSAVKGNVSAKIYTILGAEKAQVQLSAGSNRMTAGSLGLSTGIYLVKIEQEGSVLSTNKLIIN